MQSLDLEAWAVRGNRDVTGFESVCKAGTLELESGNMHLMRNQLATSKECWTVLQAEAKMRTLMARHQGLQQCLRGKCYVAKLHMHSGHAPVDVCVAVGVPDAQPAGAGAVVGISGAHTRCSSVVAQRYLHAAVVAVWADFGLYLGKYSCSVMADSACTVDSLNMKKFIV